LSMAGGGVAANAADAQVIHNGNSSNLVRRDIGVLLVRARCRSILRTSLAAWPRVVSPR